MEKEIEFHFSEKPKVLLSLVCAFVVSIANVTLAEDPVYFADPNLKAAVEVELGISNPNATDMLGLTSFNAALKRITDLTGLEHALNLTFLVLSHNKIMDINAVSGLTNLTSLSLENNQISDISAVSGLTNLTWLSLQLNQISDISSTQPDKRYLPSFRFDESD